MKCLWISGARTYATALLLLFVLGSSLKASLLAQTPANSQETTEDLDARAQQAQRRGDYRAAAEIYQAMLKRDPQLAEVRANLGLMHHQLGEYAAAIGDFQAALRDKPSLFVPNLFLGLDSLQVQKPRQAIPYLRRAHELNPRDEQAVLGLGRAYRALGDLPMACAYYDQAARLDPSNVDARFGLGLTYIDLEKEGVERLAKYHSNSPYLQALAAHLFAQQGRIGDAIVKYRKVLESGAAPTCLRAELGFALLQQGNSPDAEREFQLELENSPHCLMARLGLARIAVGNGNMTVALGELSRLWQIDRHFLTAHSPRLWVGLDPDKIAALDTALQATSARDMPTGLTEALHGALARWRREPVEAFAEDSTIPPDGAGQSPGRATAVDAVRTKATQYYSQGSATGCQETLQPWLPSLEHRELLLLAECAYDSGDFRTSFKASQQLLNTDTQNALAWYWRTKASEILAVNVLVQAGAAEPNSLKVHVLLGDAYRGRQMFKEAEAEYRKAIQLDPHDLAANLGLAATLQDVSRLDEALPQVKTVLQLAPQDPSANFIMANILVYRHEFDQAEPYAKIALHGDPSSLPRVHALLGKIYAFQDHIGEAIRELKQALPDDPDGSLHYQIGRLYRQVGDEKAASEALRQSETLRKDQEHKAQTTIQSIE